MGLYEFLCLDGLERVWDGGDGFGMEGMGLEKEGRGCGV
jgi:hypothetical protein